MGLALDFVLGATNTTTTTSQGSKSTGTATGNAHEGAHQPAAGQRARAVPSAEAKGEGRGAGKADGDGASSGAGRGKPTGGWPTRSKVDTALLAELSALHSADPDPAAGPTVDRVSATTSAEELYTSYIELNRPVVIAAAALQGTGAVGAWPPMRWADKEAFLAKHGSHAVLVSSLPTPDSVMTPWLMELLDNGEAVESGIGSQVRQMPIREYVERFIRPAADGATHDAPAAKRGARGQGGPQGGDDGGEPDGRAGDARGEAAEAAGGAGPASGASTTEDWALPGRAPVVLQTLGKDHALAHDVNPLPRLLQQLQDNFTGSPHRGHGRGAFEFTLGAALSGSHVHEHEAAWNVLVAGEKRWFLWPPWNKGSASVAAAHGLFEEVVESGAPFGETSYHTVHEWVRHQLPKLQGTPRAPLQVTQRAGELLFVPGHWPHAVLNTQPSVAVSVRMGDCKAQATPCSDAVAEKWPPCR